MRSESKNLQYESALVYGFGPYAGYQHNVTMDIVAKIEAQNVANTHIFKTQFSQAMFDSVLAQYAPALVIGLGQTANAQKIHIERKAKNWSQDFSAQGRKINPTGRPHHYVSYKIAADEHSTVTYDAGAYVCNFSMYIMGDYCLNQNAQYAFLHVPLTVDVELATNFVIKAITDWYA